MFFKNITQIYLARYIILNRLLPSLEAKFLFVKFKILMLQLIWQFFVLWYIVISLINNSPICPWFQLILTLNVTEKQVSVAKHLIFYSWVNDNKSNWGGIRSRVNWILYIYLALLFMIQKNLGWWRNKCFSTKTWEAWHWKSWYCDQFRMMLSWNLTRFVQNKELSILLLQLSLCKSGSSHCISFFW